jgi:hypothetical protein
VTVGEEYRNVTVAASFFALVLFAHTTKRMRQYFQSYPFLGFFLTAQNYHDNS